MYKGIDVSVWQGDIDFSKVKEHGIESVYIRAGEGDNITDKYFESNYQKARSAGLKYGFYHYVTARSTVQAKEQANFFANLIHTKPQDMRAAMDFENLSGLSADEAVSIAKAYLETLQKRIGHTPVVYSNAYDASSVWKGHLTAYPLWVAEYGRSEPYSTGGWKSWAGFQYSDKGTVSGISGHVDLDDYKDEIFLTEGEKSSGRTIRHTYNAANDGCKESSGGYITYVVKRGDTLSAIARKYDTTVEDLVRINNIKDPDHIYVGQQLRIPKK